MKFSPSQYHDTAELTPTKAPLPVREADDTSVAGDEFDCAHVLSAEFFSNLIRMFALSSESMTPTKSQDAGEMTLPHQMLPARCGQFFHKHWPRQSGVKA